MGCAAANVEQLRGLNADVEEGEAAGPRPALQGLNTAACSAAGRSQTVPLQTAAPQFPSAAFTRPAGLQVDGSGSEAA